MSTFSSSDLKLHWEDIISLRPLLGAWLNTDDWNRIWPVCGEIWNEEQCLSDCISKYLPPAAFVMRDKRFMPTQAGQWSGVEALHNISWWLLCFEQNSFHILCLLFFFFPLNFFYKNMGPWDFFESFLNKQNIFLTKLCISVHEVVLKVRTMIFLKFDIYQALGWALYKCYLFFKATLWGTSY